MALCLRSIKQYAVSDVSILNSIFMIALHTTRKLLLLLFIGVSTFSFAQEKQINNAEYCKSGFANKFINPNIYISGPFGSNLIRNQYQNISLSNSLRIVLKFERHKGAIFCRMEDAVEQRTKLFKLTVGVK